MSRYKKLYHKDFKKVFGVTYLPHNRVTDKRLDGWNIKTDDEYTVNPGLNERLEKKYGQQIDDAYEAAMHIKWINGKVGYGAYAEQDLKKGDMVTEYTGLVEEDNRFDEDNLYLWNYPTIMYQTPPGKKRRKKIMFCINAENHGNFARFINHSLRKYQNVGIQIVPRNNQWHVIYIAKRDIKAGEQLLTYYGVDYWRDRKIVPEVIFP